MPIIPAELLQLIKSNLQANLSAVTGVDPMSQQDPSYFLELCAALAGGITEGIPTLQFTTKDSGYAGGAPPGLPNQIPGAGTGSGFQVATAYLDKLMYTYVLNYIKQLGESSHSAWPPAADNSGRGLQAITRGIAEAVGQHFSSCWTLTSVHPDVYAGTGLVDKLVGLQPDFIASKIIEKAPRMQGPLWPLMARALALGLAEGLQEKTEGTVTIVGVCVPSPTVVCGIPNTGSGTGTAA